jgi:hypothetical protein
MRLSSGPVSVPTHRRTFRVILDADEIHALIVSLAREADEARAAGKYNFAERLDWRVADLREAAR